MGNRIITLTAENMDGGHHGLGELALPTPFTPEEKLRRYLSLKLSADFRDLHQLAMSCGPSYDPTAMKSLSD